MHGFFLDLNVTYLTVLTYGKLRIVHDISFVFPQTVTFIDHFRSGVNFIKCKNI